MEYNQPSEIVKDVSFSDIAKNKVRYEPGSKEYELNKETFERQYPGMSFDDE